MTDKQVNLLIAQAWLIATQFASGWSTAICFACGAVFLLGALLERDQAQPKHERRPQ